MVVPGNSDHALSELYTVYPEENHQNETQNSTWFKYIQHFTWVCIMDSQPSLMDGVFYSVPACEAYDRQR